MDQTAGVIGGRFALWGEVPPSVAEGFEAVDPGSMAGVLDRFCRRMLGAGIARTEFFEAGVGSVFGVRLHGRRVVVKVHGAGVSRQYLAAAQAVQRHLFADGFPAPEPLLPPTRFGRGMAVVEALLDRGERANAHDSAVRRTMAGELARLVERCRSLAAPDASASTL